MDRLERRKERRRQLLPVLESSTVVAELQLLDVLGTLREEQELFMEAHGSSRVPTDLAPSPL